MTRARDFPLQTTSVGAARRFADEVLHGLPAETVEAVRLMVSELATNSIQHAKTGFQLVINRRRDSVRIEVTDLAGGRPGGAIARPDRSHRSGAGDRGDAL